VEFNVDAVVVAVGVGVGGKGVYGGDKEEVKGLSLMVWMCSSSSSDGSRRGGRSWKKSIGILEAEVEMVVVLDAEYGFDERDVVVDDAWPECTLEDVVDADTVDVIMFESFWWVSKVMTSSSSLLLVSSFRDTMDDGFNPADKEASIPCMPPPPRNKIPVVVGSGVEVRGSSTEREVVSGELVGVADDVRKCGEAAVVTAGMVVAAGTARDGKTAPNGLVKMKSRVDCCCCCCCCC
jgi:hypothetical protein